MSSLDVRLQKLGRVSAMLILTTAGSPGCDTPAHQTPEVTQTEGALKTLTGGTLTSLNHRTEDTPWRLIGALSTQVNGVRTSRCSCIKALNQYTCLTAAHCFLNCDGPKGARKLATLPDLTFAAGGGTPRATIPAGSYGVAFPKEYWAGCYHDNRTMIREHDIAVIRLKGAYDAALNGSVALHHGNLNPTVPISSYDVGYLQPDLMVKAGATSLPVDIAGYPNVVTLPFDYKSAPAVWTYPTLALSEGYASLNALTPFNVDHTATTWRGMSGGPILYVDARGNRRLVGIHIGRGHRNGVDVLAPGQPITHNRGVWLTEGTVDLLWRLAGTP